MAEMNENTPLGAEDQNESIKASESAQNEPQDTEKEELSNEHTEESAEDFDHDDDQNSDDEQHEDDHHEEDEEEIDVSELSKQEMVAFLDSVLKADKILKHAKVVNQARNRFNEIIEEEKKAALDSFLAIEGNAEVDFQYQLQFIDRQWRDLMRTFSMKKKALKEAIVVEREQNLAKKLQLLEELKELAENAVANDAFDKLKALQEQWRNIGQVPAAELNNLNRNYRHLNDRFFDQRSLIKEFLDYDRKKNLETKQEIIGNLEQLAQNEENLRELMRHFRSLQEAWRDTGPVPRENLDEVMEAYRATVDKISEKRRQLIEVVDVQRRENLEKKKAVIEKVLFLTDDENNLTWSKRNKALGDLIEEWKKIGAVPKADNQQIRKEFTDAVKVFNKLKNTFFKEQKREKMANLQLRLDAIAKVEKLLEEGGDLKEHRNEVIKLQKYWKTLGQVPRKQSDELWNKFRQVCNVFFDRLKEGDRAKSDEQEANLAEKAKICEQIEELAAQEDPNTDDLKPLEAAWNKVGFVPFSKKKDIDKRYRDAVKKVLAQTVKMEDVAPHLTDFKLKIEELIRGENATKNLDQEMQQLRKRIQKQGAELVTLETNIQFFANSKGADKLIAPIKKQIDGIKAEISELREKEKMLRQSLDMLRN